MPKCTEMCLAAGLRPDPLDELMCSSRPSSRHEGLLLWEGLGKRRGPTSKRDKREREEKGDGKGGEGIPSPKSVKKVKVAHTRKYGCRVPELIPVLGSQPAGDVSHKSGDRLLLLSARHAATQLPSQPSRGLLPILLLGEQRHDGCEQFA